MRLTLWQARRKNQATMPPIDFVALSTTSALTRLMETLSGLSLRLPAQRCPSSPPPPLIVCAVNLHLSSNLLLIFSFSTDNSARVAEGGKLLFRPFTLTGWDHHAPRDIAAACQFDMVDSFAQLSGFGRPLYVCS